MEINRPADFREPPIQDQAALWQYDAVLLVLRHLRSGYEVDLESCRSSAQVLDWLAQVKQKTWCTSDDFAGMFDALDAVIDLQANMCSFGAERMAGRKTPR